MLVANRSDESDDDDDDEGSPNGGGLLRESKMEMKKRRPLEDQMSLRSNGLANSEKKQLLHSEDDFESNDKTQSKITPELVSGENGSGAYLEHSDSVETISPPADSIEIVVGPVKAEFADLQAKLNSKDKLLAELEAKYYKGINTKALELEGITEDQDREIERHRHLYEMKRLEELRRRIDRVEQEKIDLLRKEQHITARLTYRSKVIGEKLAELEAIKEAEARKRELTLTKLYARLNGKIRELVAYHEGNLKVIQRKRLPY